MTSMCIPRGGEVAWTGPSSFASARLYAFAVKADGMLVHEMLTRYIGQPSQDLGLHIDVRGTTLDHVFFVFLDSERHQRPLAAGPGFTGAQGEQLFAIVTVGYRIQPDPGLVLFAPYVFSSDTPGWRAEREIYGYPQQQGRVEIERDGDGPPDRLRVCARVIEEFRTGAIAGDMQILQITRKRKAAAGRARTVTAAALVKSIAERLGVKEVRPRGRIAPTVVARPRLGATAADLAFFQRRSRRAPERATRDLPMFDFSKVQMSGNLPMLFLKQFRDIVHSDRACYQAIVEARLEIEGDISQLPLDGYVLEVTNTDSVPLQRELGIPSGGVLPVEFAFELKLKELVFNEAHVISNPYWNPA